MVIASVVSSAILSKRYMPTIIGSGVSGLALRHFLLKPSRLLEKGAKAGGYIQSHTVKGLHADLGAHSFRPKPAIVELLEDLNLTEQALGKSPKARGIYDQGSILFIPPSTLAQAVSLPMLRACVGISVAVFKDISKVFFPLQSRPKDVSVHQFCHDQFGAYVARLSGAVVAGIFAGDPKQLSLQACLPTVDFNNTYRGSFLVGVLRRKMFNIDKAEEPNLDIALNKQNRAQPSQDLHKVATVSFPQGLGQLINTLEDQGEIEFNTHVNSGDLASLLAQGPVAIAPSLPQLVQLLGEDSPKVLLDLVELTPYATVGVANVLISRDYPLPLDCFGHLVTTSNALKALGVIYDSNVFPEQVADNEREGGGGGVGRQGMQGDFVDGDNKQGEIMGESKVVDNFTSTANQLGRDAPLQMVSVMVGGSRDAFLEEDLDDLAEAIVKEHLGVDKVEAVESVVWKRCIPQYGVGHVQLSKQVVDALKKSHPNLYLMGNAFHWGVGVSDMVQRAKEVAREIEDRV